MVRVKVLKLSYSKNLRKTKKKQNFFNHGENKGIQTERFYGF